MNIQSFAPPGCATRHAARQAPKISLAKSEQTLTGLSERLARQEKRMNTHQATQESAMDRLRADMAKRDAELAKRDAERDAELAKRDAARDVELTKRDKDNSRWLIGMWTAAVIVLCTFLSALIT